MKAASSNKTIVQMFLLVVAIDVIVLRLQQTMQLSDKNVFFFSSIVKDQSSCLSCVHGRHELRKTIE
jgi:hypothetical protein